MDAYYMQVLMKRYEYFKDKKITELTQDEIKEYLNLQNEILEAMPEVKETVERAWGVVKEYLQPYTDAYAKYKERVLK